MRERDAITQTHFAHNGRAHVTGAVPKLAVVDVSVDHELDAHTAHLVVGEIAFISVVIGPEIRAVAVTLIVLRRKKWAGRQIDATKKQCVHDLHNSRLTT